MCGGGGLSMVWSLSYDCSILQRTHAHAPPHPHPHPFCLAFCSPPQPFQLYGGGVFDSECGTALDHGMLVVGYGMEYNHTHRLPYWLLKNSWGPAWGDSGYIKLARGMGQQGEGQCGIAMQASVPIKKGPNPPKPPPTPPSPGPDPGAASSPPLAPQHAWTTHGPRMDHAWTTHAPMHLHSAVTMAIERQPAVEALARSP